MNTISILAFIWLVLMALFWAAIWRDSVLPFLRYVHVFSCEMSLVSRLKRPSSCFSSRFCFLAIFVLLIFMSSVLFLVAVIRIPLSFSVLSLSRCIDALTFSMQVSPLPPSFLDTYSLSTSSVGCKTLFLVINFLVLWSICSTSSLVHFKNGPEYLTRGTTQVFIPFTRFLFDFE